MRRILVVKYHLRLLFSLQELIERRRRKMKDFQGYRQKKNNEFAQQKAQRIELRNGNKISHSRDTDEHRMAVPIGCQSGS